MPHGERLISRKVLMGDDELALQSAKARASRALHPWDRRFTRLGTRNACREKQRRNVGRVLLKLNPTRQRVDRGNRS
jgi:hypothetical protein